MLSEQPQGDFLAKANAGISAEGAAVASAMHFVGHQVLRLVPFLSTIEFPLQRRFNG